MVCDGVDLIGVQQYVLAKCTLNVWEGHRTAVKAHVQALVMYP